MRSVSGAPLLPARGWTANEATIAAGSCRATSKTPTRFARDEHPPAARADEERHRDVRLVVGALEVEVGLDLHRAQLAAMVDESSRSPRP